MSGRGLRLRREPVAVLGRSVKVGVVAALPVTALMLTESIVQALARGANWGLAWSAAGWTDEDLEMVPAVAVCAVLLAGLAAAAGVWLAVTWRMAGGSDDESEGYELGRSWVARWAAVFAAAAVPGLLLVIPNWPTALAGALCAAIVALLAEPRVAYRSAAAVTVPG